MDSQSSKGNSQLGMCASLHRVFDVFQLVAMQEQVADWQGPGSKHGYVLPCSRGASSSDHALSQAPPSRSTTFKGEFYKELIKGGERLNNRRCAKAPEKKSEACVHPMECLKGAGNANQSEVWCQMCHARWLVDHRATKKLAQKKEEIRMGNKIFRPDTMTVIQVKSEEAAKETPKSKSLEAKLKEELRKEVKQEAEMTEMDLYQRLWEKQQALEKEEMDMYQEMALKEQALAMQEQALKEEAQGAVQNTLAEAELRHHVIMEAQQQNYVKELNMQREQIEMLKDQMCWLTAVAGQERVTKVQQDPNMAAQVHQQAMELKQNMNMAAAASSGSQGPVDSGNVL